MPSFLSRFSSKASKDKLRAANSSPKASSSATFAPPLSLDLPSPNLLHRASEGNLTPAAVSSSANSVRKSDRDSVATGNWVKVKSEDAAAAERDRAKVAAAVFSLAQAQTLFDKCGAVIREHGLTTLGLFRPYRLSESQREIVALELLFLRWADDGKLKKDDDDDDDLFAPAANKSKAETLARFEAELKFAHIHDVVAVLKWGLRHLALIPSLSGADATAPPLDWFSALGPNPNFAAIQAALPAPSQAFLLSTLQLIEGVAAYTESNAMPVRKLCRSLGLYVLGLCPPSKKWANWEQLYSSWAQAGDVLEGIFKAYLRSQTNLPLRLREVLEAVPSGRVTKVARVDVTSQGDWHKRSVPSNDQSTGLVSSSAGFAGPRQPLEILVAAFATSPIDANCDDDELLAAWAMLSHRGQVDPKAILSDEVRRILALAKLDALPSAPANAGTSSPNRRRSASHDELVSRASAYSRAPLGALSEESPAKANGAVAPASPLDAHFPNKSVANLTAPAEEAEPSWADFASSGFGSSNSLSEGLTVPKDDPLTRAKTLGARSGSRYGQGPDKPRTPVSTLQTVRWFEVEEELADAWLDTLVETSARGAFSPFVLAQLAKDQAPIEHLLVVEQLVPFPQLPGMERSNSNNSTGLRRAASIADSTMSRRWKSRASSIFGGKDRSRPTSPLASPNVSPVKQRSYRARPGAGAGAGALSESADDDGANGLVRTLSRSLSRRRSFSKGSTAALGSPVKASTAPPVPKLSMDVSSLPSSPTKSKTFEEAVREEASQSSSLNRKLEDAFAAQGIVAPPAAAAAPLELNKDLPAVEGEDEYNEEADSSVVDESVLMAAGVGDASSAALLRKILAEERASLKSPDTPRVEYNDEEEIIDSRQVAPEAEVVSEAKVESDVVLHEASSPVPEEATLAEPVEAEPAAAVEEAAPVESAVAAEANDEPAPEMRHFAPAASVEESAAHERRASVDTVKPTDDPSPSAPVEQIEQAAVVGEPLAPATPVKSLPPTPATATAPESAKTPPASDHLTTPLARSTSETSVNTTSPSSGKKRLLKGMGSFLSRSSKGKNSPSKSPTIADKDKAAKAKALAEKEELKALQKVELEKKVLEAKQAPAPVSSVRKRVLELEAENRRAEEKRIAALAARGAASPVVLSGGNNSANNSRPGTPTPGAKIVTAPTTAAVPSVEIETPSSAAESATDPIESTPTSAVVALPTVQHEQIPEAAVAEPSSVAAEEPVAVAAENDISGEGEEPHEAEAEAEPAVEREGTVGSSLPSHNPSEHSLVSESEVARSFRTAAESDGDMGDDEPDEGDRTHVL